jgi:hypothetical protein
VRQDQRSWLEVRGGLITTSEGRPVFAPITVTNIGKTPATNISIKAIVQKVINGSPPALLYEGRPINLETAGILYPTRSFDLHAMSMEKLSPTVGVSHALTHAEFEELLEGKSYIAIYAEMTYTDIFGITHWVHFCVFDSPGHKTVFGGKACSDYNQVDNN